MLVTALGGSSETINTVVALLGRQTLKSELNCVALLLQKIIGPVGMLTLATLTMYVIPLRSNWVLSCSPAETTSF
jgi:hypothetical protein